MATGPLGLPPDGAAPHVIVADLDEVALDDDTLHHLTRVRRLRTGDRFTATDGVGRWRWCRLDDGASIDGDLQIVERRTPPITVAFALTKGDKPEFVVQKLTELGVDQISAFRAERSVVHWDAKKSTAAVEKWRRVSRAAVSQSGGCFLPDITEIGTVDDLVAMGASRLDRRGEPPNLDRATVAIGPEGGWSPGETQQLPSAVSLGDLVLRAETAALTAGALLCSLRTGLVGSAPRIRHGG